MIIHHTQKHEKISLVRLIQMLYVHYVCTYVLYFLFADYKFVDAIDLRTLKVEHYSYFVHCSGRVPDYPVPSDLHYGET